MRQNDTVSNALQVTKANQGYEYEYMHYDAALICVKILAGDIHGMMDAVHRLPAGGVPMSAAVASPHEAVPLTTTAAAVPGRRTPHVLRQYPLDLDEHHAIRQGTLVIHEVDESIALTQAVEPDARPRGKVIPANLVVADREAHKRELLNEAANAAEGNLLAGKVDVAAAVGSRALLELALVAVAIVERGQVGCVDVNLRLDVWLESLHSRVVVWERDCLRCEEGDVESEGFPRNRRNLRGLGLEVGAEAFGRSLLAETIACGGTGSYLLA